MRALSLLLVLACAPLVHAAPDARQRANVSARKKTISLDVQDAEVRSVLRLLADTADMNLVVADSVKGKVTLKLTNVPWDAALRVVLASKAFGAVVDDDIIRVATLTELDDEERRRLERATTCEDKAPLVTRFIPVSYASAAEMKPLVEATLTKRGKVTFDERTNVLIVRDVRCP